MKGSSDLLLSPGKTETSQFQFVPFRDLKESAHWDIKIKVPVRMGCALPAALRIIRIML